MLKKFAHVLMITACNVSMANEIHACMVNGTKVYQNWPCDTKPEIEQPVKKKENYEKIVDCSMKNAFDRITYELISGNKKIIKDCKQ